MEFPKGLKYSEEHVWISVKDDIATIGITDFASKELGGILFVDLPDVGDIIDQGESFGTIESAKTISDLFAPASGKVVEINSDLEGDPGIINEYPYDDGWLIKIELTDEDELDILLDNVDYKDYVEEEKDDEDYDDDEYEDDDDDFDDEDEDEDDEEYDDDDDDEF